MLQNFNESELMEHFSISEQETNLIANKAGSTRIGFAVMLKYYQFEGRFPKKHMNIPEIIVNHIAEQVGVIPESFSKYKFKGRSVRYHRNQIQTS